MSSECIAKSTGELAQLIASFNDHAAELADFAGRVVDVFHRDGRLLLMGSGPLGPIANLAAARFLHRLSLERPPLPALSLNQDRVLAAGLERDGQGGQYFARQLRALSPGEDIVLILADNPREEVVQQALTAARELDCYTALVIPAREEVGGEASDLTIRLETDSPARFAEALLFLGHLLCELVEAELFGI